MRTDATQMADPRELAAARAGVYGFLIAALDKPSREQHAWLGGGTFALALAELCERFGADRPPDGPLVPPEFDDYQADYIATFEVGMPAPPVVLLASHYNRREPAPRIIHEHLTLYRRFGARPADGNIEPPDHLLNELSFLVRLDELLIDGQVDAESVLRARRDFLHRHVARWPGQALDALAAAPGRRSARSAAVRPVAPLYRTLLSLLAAAVGQDLELSESAVAALTEERA